MPRIARTSSIAILVALASLTVARAGDQQSTPARNTRADHWVLPRTADGHPDLEGSWENNSATPLERPRQLADKPRLTDEELS